MLGKSLLAGVGITALAGLARQATIVGQSDISDVTGWANLIGEHGVLVSLAIYFLWRDWKREKESDIRAKDERDKAHERHIADIKSKKDFDSAEIRSKKEREQQLLDKWTHSEKQRETLQLELINIVRHMLLQRDRQLSITDTDTNHIE